MVGLLVHGTLGGNLETKTSLARKRVHSCLKQALNVTPPSQLLKLLCSERHCSALAASVGKHQSMTDSTASKSATRFRATHKGSNDGSGKDRLTQQAGRQAGRQHPWFLSQPAVWSQWLSPQALRTHQSPGTPR